MAYTSKRPDCWIKCEVCAADKYYPPSVLLRIAGRFCSKKCEAISRIKPESHVSVVCAHCAKEFVRDVHRVKEQNFCSKECVAAYQKSQPSVWGKTFDPEARREYFRKYGARNRARVNEMARRWGRENRDYRNTIQQVRRAGGSLTRKEWGDVLDRYGRSCARCKSKSDLQMDHIVPVAAGGLTVKTNVQPLCGPCNRSKSDSREFLI